MGGFGAQALWAQIFLADRFAAERLAAIDLAAQLFAERWCRRQFAAGLRRCLECWGLICRGLGNAALLIGTRRRTGLDTFANGVPVTDSIALPRSRQCPLPLHDFRDRVWNSHRTISRDTAPLITPSRSHQSFDARFQAFDRAVQRVE